MQRHERIDSERLTLVLAADGTQPPTLIYFGKRLPDAQDLTELESSQAIGWRESTPDMQPPQNILPTNGWGWMGEPALRVHGMDTPTPIRWSSCEMRRHDKEIKIALHADIPGVLVNLNWALDAMTGILSARATIENTGKEVLHLSQLASLYLPVSPQMSEIIAFEGDWSRELQPSRFTAPPGLWRRLNRTGRTGFAGSTFLTLEPDAGDFSGAVTAVHLAWSGNHELTVETLPDGRRAMIASALLDDGEVILAPGETFAAPCAYVSKSLDGFNGVSDAFHPFVRDNILPATAHGARKVHFNSWESVGFEFNEAELLDLADSCAAIGVERFVLDDGWFKGRRNDTTSLGDWSVDAGLFPTGLHPLIKRVHDLGMDFGLWVEPEMVSPDSDLYREHPDWCIHAPGDQRPTMRNQLWLDIARDDVRSHLFNQLDTLLRTYDIAYLKWDCNRFQFPAMAAGRPGSSATVKATYDLLDRLKDAHPKTEIESCASGGARIDLEILKRTSRVWPSDTTDAIERLRIQRWNGLVLPPEILGAHVGPYPNPITGRKLGMDFRARVAMFGHMGVEVDPRTLSDLERSSLTHHIALYKQHRDLIHSGRMIFWALPDGGDARAVISNDRTEALVLACQTAVAENGLSAPLTIPGLDSAATYRVRLVEPWPAVVARLTEQLIGLKDGLTFRGAALTSVGLRLPLSDPETAWLIHIQRAG